MVAVGLDTNYQASGCSGLEKNMTFYGYRVGAELECARVLTFGRYVLFYGVSIVLFCL